MAEAEKGHPRRAERRTVAPVPRHHVAPLRGGRQPQGGGENRG